MKPKQLEAREGHSWLLWRRSLRDLSQLRWVLLGPSFAGSAKKHKTTDLANKKLLPMSLLEPTGPLAGLGICRLCNLIAGRQPGTRKVFLAPSVRSRRSRQVPSSSLTEPAGPFRPKVQFLAFCLNVRFGGANRPKPTVRLAQNSR